MCVHMHVYVYVRMHMHTHAHANACAHTCICMCMCVHVYVCTVCVYHMPTQGLIKHKKVDHDRVKTLSLVSRLIQIAESVREPIKYYLEFFRSHTTANIVVRKC